jgi:isopropylmalate/homocitrate/citramalate synthase
MKDQPWEQNKYSVSPYNFDEEVVSSFNLPEKIYMYDVTLRDGEQCPGVVFRKGDKTAIAKVLDEVGVPRIEAGMPAVSEDDFQAVKEIANLGLSAKVKCFCRAMKDDIDLALKADVWGVVIELPSSEMLIETGYQWPVERVKRRPYMQRITACTSRSSA